MERMERMAQKALDYAEERLLSPETGLIYDFPLHEDAAFYPTAEECARHIPNPVGYGVGMEDCMIHGGTLLDAAVTAWEKTGNARFRQLAARLARGMLSCREQALSPGFLPRGVSPVDGRSHYADSSRDQYTLFVFGLFRYLEGRLASEEDVHRMRLAAESLATRAEKNVRPETGYDMLREDGKPSLVTALWGPSLGNHEMHRLPMIYLFAHRMTGDEHWLAAYRALREEACARALPMGEYWHLYAVQQMLASLYVLRALDGDAGWRARYASLMDAAADCCGRMAGSVAQKLAQVADVNVPQPSFRECRMKENPNLRQMGENCLVPARDTEEFFRLQDAAVISAAYGLAGKELPGDCAELFRQAFSRIDFDRHQRATPVHFLAAYWRNC